MRKATSNTPSVHSDSDVSPSQANVTMWFETLSAYEEYQVLVHSLRNALRNWCNKKNKSQKDLDLKSIQVNSLIDQIISLIDKKALPNKVSLLKNKTYSIGDRKHRGKRFCFDKKRLTKEFRDKIIIRK